MPHVTLTVTPDGLTLPVVIGLTGKDSADLLAAGQLPPNPRLLRGAIDTATTITVVAASVLSQFGLKPLKSTTTQGIGGSHPVHLFEVSFRIPRVGPQQQSLFVLDYLVVMDWTSPPPGLDVLVGLDVLEQLWTFYDGPRKEFTLGD